jgi:hypothetical protein
MGGQLSRILRSTLCSRTRHRREIQFEGTDHILCLSNAQKLSCRISGRPRSNVAGKRTIGAPAPVKTGYAPVNGLKMYYEIHGTGEPLVLIHGGVVGITVFGPNVEALAKGRQVVAVEFAQTVPVLIEQSGPAGGVLFNRDTH